MCQTNLYYIILQGKCKSAIKYPDKKTVISLKPHFTGVILTTVSPEYLPDGKIPFDYLQELSRTFSSQGNNYYTHRNISVSMPLKEVSLLIRKRKNLNEGPLVPLTAGDNFIYLLLKKGCKKIIKSNHKLSLLFYDIIDTLKYEIEKCIYCLLFF